MGRTVLGLCLLIAGLVLLWEHPVAWWLPQWIAVVPLAGAVWIGIGKFDEVDREERS